MADENENLGAEAQAAAAAAASAAAAAAQAETDAAAQRAIEQAQEETRRAEQAAADIAAGAMKSDHGRDIETLKNQVSECQSKISTMESSQQNFLTEIRNLITTPPASDPKVSLSIQPKSADSEAPPAKVEETITKTLEVTPQNEGGDAPGNQQQTAPQPKKRRWI